MSSDFYPDLFGQAVQSSARDAARFSPVVAMAVRQQMLRRLRRARLQAEQEEKARRAILTREQAARAAARVRWAPATDPGWLRNAGLVETATAWGAAVVYSDDPAAAAVVRNCEDRLRDLHPSAMAEYDRKRASGLGPLAAMRASVPVFMQRPAHERPATAQRQALSPGGGLGHSWVAAVHSPTRADLDRELQRRRGVQISANIQRRAGTLPLSADELGVSLEAVTNLPDDLIAAVVESRSTGHGVLRRPWQQDFPFPIKAVVAAAAARQRPAVGVAGEPGAERRRVSDPPRPGRPRGR